MSTPNQIVLISPYGRHEEDIASEAITPGHLVEIHASSGRKLRKHSTAGGHAEYALAKEDALQGNEIADAYAADDVVSYHLFKSGDVGYAMINAGENIAIGEKLVSNGDGTLVAATNPSGGSAEVPLAIAEEALDLSATGAVDTRVAVRFI